MISLFPSSRTSGFCGRLRSLQPPDIFSSLPIRTSFVTPGPPELHFYSGRHVRARVRLHLRRVTGNNNTEIGEGGRGRQMATLTGNERSSDGKGRKLPSGSESTRLNSGRISHGVHILNSLMKLRNNITCIKEINYFKKLY